MICLSLTEKSIAENLRLAKSERDHVDCYEIRADFLGPDELSLLDRFPRRLEKPCILTLRRRSDGGQFDGPDSDRAAIFGRYIGAGFRWFDWELDFRPRLFSAGGSSSKPRREDPSGKGERPRIIRSHHDTEGMPSDPAALARSLSADKTEIPKIAVTPGSTGEFFALLDLAGELAALLEGRERILLGMGDWGFPTRVLPSRFGSCLSYCTAGVVKAAPGHVRPKELDLLYRLRSQTGNTRVYGIIGNPVMHSRSPLIHNAGFAELGLDAVYVPFPTDDPGLFLDRAPEIGIEGMSVTVPHKRALLSRFGTLGSAAAEVGACNTIVRRKEGWAGFNYDVPGFLEPLKRVWKDSGKKHRRAVVLGSGGAARAVVYALVTEGLDVLVLNRTYEKADLLARELGCRAGRLDEAGIAGAGPYTELIVQTTAAGMHPLEEVDPFSGYVFKGDETVYEIIYVPRETLLVRRALEAGCRVIYGEDMLFGQACLQFEEFTGRPYPREALPKYDRILQGLV
jgi:3-dehydroquinate dehydratase/shikimate dehydrogenase